MSGREFSGDQSVEPDADRAATLARGAMRPTVKAAITVQAFAKPAFGELDLAALADELSAQIGAVTKGDLQRAEAMLIAQAHTLESLFYELARRAALSMGEHLHAAETYMRLALKAQSQCRATLETLTTIKNPTPLAFVRQTNIAHGPQQVNNATPAGSCSCPQETGNPCDNPSHREVLTPNPKSQHAIADPEAEAVRMPDRS